MIEVYSNNINVLPSATIPLNNVILLKGISTTPQGASSIQINKCGIYKVTVTATVSATSAGDIILQLRKNGVLQPQTLTTVTSSGTATDLYPISFTTLVQVSNSNDIMNLCSVPTVVEIVNAGIEATFNTLDVVITRI